MTKFGPDVIAHRGASSDAPENTLAAFELAWQQGADGIEGDFRLTSDGHVVCAHDATTRRVSAVVLGVAESALCDLRRLDVGSWKGPEWAGQRIPTLQEVLAAVAEGKKLFAEIKCGVEVFPPFQSVVEASAVRPDQLVLMSFSKDVVAEAKRRFPSVKALWITKFEPGPGRQEARVQPSLEEILETLGAIGADGLDAEGHGSVNAALARGIRQAGFELHVWSKGDVGQLERFADLDVESITTNFPGALKAAIALRRKGQGGS